MKRYLHILFLLLTMLTAACSQEQTHDHAANGTAYTCPMHPQIVQDEPGTCPVCGMDLVPANARSTEVAGTDDLAHLPQPGITTVVASVATIRPERKSVQATVEMEGIITYDPNRVFSIPARVSGRIEQLYVKYNFQPVRKGQKLMEIYSPELVTAQKELLYLVQSAPEDQQLIGAARQRLRLLGATEAQINRLIRTGQESYTFALYSPYNGYVISLNTSAQSATTGQAGPVPTGAGGGMDGMGGGAGVIPSASGAPGIAPSGQDIQLREGIYVSAGQPLLRVVNTNRLWAEFNLPAGEISPLAKGTPVQISFPQLPGDTLGAQIDFLQPFYGDGENFAKVRVYLPGSHQLAMVGQLVEAHVVYRTAPALWVPKAAVLDLGTQSVVFRKMNEVFQPVAVTAGPTEGGEIQILEGLRQTDVIAANAQFLIDSETFIRMSKF